VTWRYTTYLASVDLSSGDHDVPHHQPM